MPLRRDEALACGFNVDERECARREIRAKVGALIFAPGSKRWDLGNTRGRW
jgi:hypothetical protein